MARQIYRLLLTFARSNLVGYLLSAVINLTLVAKHDDVRFHRSSFLSLPAPRPDSALSLHASVEDLVLLRSRGLCVGRNPSSYSPRIGVFPRASSEGEGCRNRHVEWSQVQDLHPRSWKGTQASLGPMRVRSLPHVWIQLLLPRLSRRLPFSHQGHQGSVSPYRDSLYYHRKRWSGRWRNYRWIRLSISGTSSDYHRLLPLVR